MEGNSMPRTIDEVFQDYQNRRAGICKALTNDVEEFHQQCDPEKENLCLYGHPDGNWEVDLPAEEVPPEIPEPALGINFAREGMPRRDWLSLVAVHSDAWLLAVASFYGACFDKQGRKRLFNMINELPTVLEVVTGRKPPKEKTPVSNGSGGGGGSANKSKSSTKMPQRANEAQGKPTKQSNPPPPQPREQEEEEEEEETLEEDEEGEEEHGDTLCGSCGGFYGADEFWICCDLCEVWYHGKCVKITPARAEHIKQYKCPSCQSNKRARPAGM